MISEEEIKQRQAQLDKEPIIYEWEVIYPAIAGKNGKLIRFCVGALPLLIVAILYTWFVVLKEAYITLIPMYVGLGLACYFVYFLQLSDNKCRYQLTKKGVITYTQQNIPEAVYRFFRGFAWFGMGVCVVAAVVVGPAVFVGAGAFALMSFAFRDFKPKINKGNYIFGNKIKIYDIYEEKHIMIMCSPFMQEGNVLFYYNSIEQKENILIYLNSVLNQPDFLKVTTTKEAFEDDFLKNAFKLYNEINRERNQNHQ